MNLWEKIRHIRPTRLIQFGIIFLKRPLLLVPVWKATKGTLKVCDRLYGNLHHGTGKANAFRHAFWNYQLCQKTLKITRDKQKSVNFTQKLVDFYEKAAKTKWLDQAMDLHNNAIGRAYFLLYFDENDGKITYIMQKLAENAKKVDKIEEIQTYHNALVYLNDDPC